MKKFGDTELGQGLGCGFVIISISIGLALLRYVLEGGK